MSRSINDSLRRYTDALIADRMDNLTDKRREKESNEKLRRHAEDTIYFTLEHMFSADAIGRGAERLGGDRTLAMDVIRAAFGATPTGKEGALTCEKCGRSDVISVAPYGSHPAQVICSDHGMIAAPENNDG